MQVTCIKRILFTPTSYVSHHTAMEYQRRGDRQQLWRTLYSGSGTGWSADWRKGPEDVEDIAGRIYKALCGRHEVGSFRVYVNSKIQDETSQGKLMSDFYCKESRIEEL